MCRHLMVTKVRDYFPPRDNAQSLGILRVEMYGRMNHKFSVASYDSAHTLF
jgi:hypothetical protein